MTPEVSLHIRAFLAKTREFHEFVADELERLESLSLSPDGNPDSDGGAFYVMDMRLLIAEIDVLLAKSVAMLAEIVAMIAEIDAPLAKIGAPIAKIDVLLAKIVAMLAKIVAMLAKIDVLSDDAPASTQP